MDFQSLIGLFEPKIKSRLVETTPLQIRNLLRSSPALRSLCKSPPTQHLPRPAQSASDQMATTSTPTASIAIPSDVHPFAANVSPRGVDLEGRLDLSLDALIKERKKEHKLLKKEEASKQKQKPQPADKRKTPKQQKPQQQQKQQKTVKNGQAVQRKALVNKNRGLPATSAAVKDKTSQNKTKTSIAATTAKLRRQMRAEKADKNASGRLVTSPRTAKGTHQNNVVQQVKKNKNTPQQARKVTSPTRFVQPKGGKKQQPQTQAIAPVRQVMRSNNKKTKLSITIPGSAGKKNAQKKQKNANKVLLPGKLSQTLAKKNSAAKKVVKRAKNRKAVSGKATQVVRKGTGQRKKN